MGVFLALVADGEVQHSLYTRGIRVSSAHLGYGGGSRDALECCTASPRPTGRWAAHSPFLPDTGQNKTSQQNLWDTGGVVHQVPTARGCAAGREQARKEQTSQRCTLAGLNRLQRAVLVAQLSPRHPTAPGEHWEHYPHVPWGPQLAEDASSNSRSPSDTLGFVLLCTKMLLGGPGSTEGPRCGCAL